MFAILVAALAAAAVVAEVPLEVALPLLAAVGLCGVLGGPRRVRVWLRRRQDARHRMRVERESVARVARERQQAERRSRRRQVILDRTGLDVDVLAAFARIGHDVVTTRAGKVVQTAGARVTTLLESQLTRQGAWPSARAGTPARATPDPASAWLDLDVEIDRIAAHRRTGEIARLARELGAERARYETAHR